MSAGAARLWRIVAGRKMCGALIGAVLVLATVAESDEVMKLTDDARLVPHHRQHAPMVIRERHGGMVSSTNWSGYAVTGAAGSMTGIKGSWVVPAILGACTSQDQYSALWVGIDGYSSSTVEQLGTDTDCQGGVPTYYAWIEFYPYPSLVINSLAISPGDTISAGVYYVAGYFVLTMTNVTTGQNFHVTVKARSQQRSSVEWIAEAPSLTGGVLPLADFGMSFFGQDYTGVSSTSDAIVNGTVGTIGSFGSNVQQITMVSGGGVTEAAPSPLSTSGSSFSVQWESSGK